MKKDICLPIPVINEYSPSMKNKKFRNMRHGAIQEPFLIFMPHFIIIMTIILGMATSTRVMEYSLGRPSFREQF